MQFRTRAIHVGQEADRTSGAVVPPIHLASTFVLPAAVGPADYDYARTGSPTRHAFEAVMASLDGGARAIAFASGMAATHCVTMLLKPGDHLVTGTDIYGGSWRLFNNVLSERGISVSAVDTTDLAAVQSAIRAETKMLWIEPTGNPLLSVTDVAGCAEITKAAGVLLIADNTLATPVLCRPLELGADIVMHSATKFIGGHSDLLGGVLVARDSEVGEKLHWMQNATGAVMGPLESFLCCRGVKTLELRVHAQSATAMRLASWLQKQQSVKRVYYPGLEDDPGFATAKKQYHGGCGAMVSFEVDADVHGAQRFVESTQLFQLAVSLGAVESLIELPAVMSHGAYAPEARQAVGITDGLIRLSVGLEGVEDLEDDLSLAMTKISGS